MSWTGGVIMSVCEKRMIAFIDLLGFSDYIIKNDGNKEIETETFDFLSTLRKTTLNMYRTLRKCKGGEELITISDSIIISLPIYKDPSSSFLNIFQLISEFQKVALEGGWLSRGGIAVGNVYQDNAIIFGKAYIEAVKLEKKAKYPRIIITEDVLCLIKNSPWFSWVLKDKDNSYFIDYLWHIQFHCDGQKILEDWRKRIIDVLKNETNYDIIEKYLWLKDYFNYSVSGKNDKCHQFYNNKLVIADDSNRFLCNKSCIK
jgi:hypothetical protein